MNLLSIPDYFPLKKYFTTTIFIGRSNTGTQLHYDPTENIVYSVGGTKEVFLVPGNQTNKLYPLSIRCRNANFSKVFLPDFDANSYKRCHNLNIFYGEIHEGESLYIPCGWWHYIINKKDTISLTFTWKASAYRLFNWQQLRYLTALKLSRVN